MPRKGRPAKSSFWQELAEPWKECLKIVNVALVSAVGLAAVETILIGLLFYFKKVLRVELQAWVKPMLTGVLSLLAVYFAVYFAAKHMAEIRHSLFGKHPGKDKKRDHA